MEFLGGLFKAKKENNKKDVKEEASKPQLTQDVLDDVFMTANIIRNQNKKKRCSLMKFTKGAGLTDSKVGGIPFMTAKTEIPMCDNYKNQMLMLCQINCADVPHGLGLPTSGLYQVWIDPEYAGTGSYDDTEYFKVLYYNVIDEEKNGLTAAEIEEKYRPKTNSIIKINGEFKIHFDNPVVDTPSLYDPSVYSKFLETIEKKYIKGYQGYNMEDLSSIIYAAFDESASNMFDAEKEFENKYLIPESKKAKIGGYIPCTFLPNEDDTTFQVYDSHINDVNLVLCYFDLKNKELFTIPSANNSETVYWGITCKDFESVMKGKIYCPSQIVWRR